MKKFTLFFILLLFASFAYAQKFSLKNFSVGVNGAATYSRIINISTTEVKQSDLPQNNQQLSIGYSFGTNIGYLISLKWHIQTGVSYVMAKTKYVSDNVYYNKDSLIVNGHAKNENATHLLMIPLTASYQFFSKRNSAFVQAGGGLNIYLADHTKYSIRQSSTNNVIATDDITYRNAEHRTSIIAIAFGGGYRYGLSKHIDAEAAATYNFSTSPWIKRNETLVANYRVNYMQIGFSLLYHFLNTKK